MPRRKLPSKIIAAAEMLAAALESIDPSLDLGNGYTLAAFRATISTTSSQENRFFQAVTVAEDERTRWKEMEDALAMLSELYVKAVEVKHGTGSAAHLKVGGKAVGDRRRGPRKTPVIPAAPSTLPTEPPKA